MDVAACGEGRGGAGFYCRGVACDVAKGKEVRIKAKGVERSKRKWPGGSLRGIHRY